MPPIVRHWLAHATISNFAIAAAIYFSIAFICGVWMQKKGRNSVLGFCLAFFLPVVGVLAVAFYPSVYKRTRVRKEMIASALAAAGTRPQAQGSTAAAAPPVATQNCPFCNSKVPLEASVCRVCQVPMAQYATA